MFKKVLAYLPDNPVASVIGYYDAELPPLETSVVDRPSSVSLPQEKSCREIDDGDKYLKVILTCKSTISKMYKMKIQNCLVNFLWL